MLVNPNLVEAARKTVLGQYRSGALLQIDGYRGMYVAESGNELIHALHFFSEGDRRFVFGPRMKAAGRVKD